MKKQNIVFLTGAGMSVESGFKTFRGQDGLWENYPVEEVATHDAWERNPALLTDFYNMLRRKLWQAQPNEGHRLIKELEKNYHVTVVTQNVDDLHERAGSTNVIHLHGELSKACSSDEPYNPKYIVQLNEENSDIAQGQRAADGSLLRPFIVFFQESVPMFEAGCRAAMQADIFVVIGTSLNVYPAASLVGYVPNHAQIYLIDPDEVKMDMKRVRHIAKGASEGMMDLMAELTK